MAYLEVGEEWEEGFKKNGYFFDVNGGLGPERTMFRNFKKNNIFKTPE